MCGIFGLLKKNGFSQIEKNQNSLRHRGPDEFGFHDDDIVYMAHSRLAITSVLDGKQPFYDKQSGIVTIVNGEIYNYFELKAKLIEVGCNFTTSSDCEVIHWGYIKFGKKFFDELVGIFSFAIWDPLKKSLILCRDHLGVKPLYYYIKDKSVAFASEIKSLITEAGVEPSMCQEALAEFLFYRYVRSDKTLYKNIFKLLAGQIIEISEDVTNISEMEMITSSVGTISPERQHKFLLTLNEVVRSQLMGSAKFGVFLSGGLDSSTICALTSIFSTEKLRTYCVEFDDYTDNSEAEFASLVSKHYQTEHSNVKLSSQEILENIMDIAWHYDEPMGDAAVIPTFLVAKKAKKDGVKVIFAGEGADELFAGYDKYREMMDLYNSGVIDKENAYKLWEKNVSVFNFKNLESMNIQKKYVDSIQNVFIEDFKNIPETKDEFIQRLLQLDRKSMLAENYLMKADKMTMAHGIEERVPFLDQRVVSFAAQLNWSDLTKRFDSSTSEKSILKDALHTLLPISVINRKKKGYGTPTDQWFQGKFYEILMMRLPKSKILGSLNPCYIKGLLEGHKHNQTKENVKLWSLFSLDLWHYIYIENKGIIDNVSLDDFVPDFKFD